jgi:hypothetical protein
MTAIAVSFMALLSLVTKAQPSMLKLIWTYSPWNLMQINLTRALYSVAAGYMNSDYHNILQLVMWQILTLYVTHFDTVAITSRLRLTQGRYKKAFAVKGSKGAIVSILAVLATLVDIVRHFSMLYMWQLAFDSGDEEKKMRVIDFGSPPLFADYLMFHACSLSAAASPELSCKMPIVLLPVTVLVCF